MQLYFKQRLFSWFDSYDIYNAADGSVAFTVEGQLAWGHCLHILDPQGRHIATVQQRVLTFLPKFDLYVGERCIGQIRKEFTLFRPSFVLDGLGWQVEGSFMEWDYRITDGHDIDAATADHLLFTCGSLMTDLLPEIGKVSAFAKGQSVTIADINAVVEPRLEARVFDMTRAITAGSYNEAAHILGELLRQRTEPIMILAAVGKELRQLYTARMALDAGKDRFWLKQVWGMNSDYPAKLLLQAARRVDHRWCQDAVQACQVLDRRMKSEKNIDSEDELKLFLMGLAARR